MNPFAIQLKGETLCFTKLHLTITTRNTNPVEAEEDKRNSFTTGRNGPLKHRGINTQDNKRLNKAQLWVMNRCGNKKGYLWKQTRKQ